LSESVSFQSFVGQSTAATAFNRIFWFDIDEDDTPGGIQNEFAAIRREGYIREISELGGKAVTVPVLTLFFTQEVRGTEEILDDSLVNIDNAVHPIMEDCLVKNNGLAEGNWEMRSFRIDEEYPKRVPSGERVVLDAAIHMVHVVGQVRR
jgi:hypothetical protein